LKKNKEEGGAGKEASPSPPESNDPGMNPPPKFIEIVLQYIFNIYQREFEEKKQQLSEEE